MLKLHVTKMGRRETRKKDHYQAKVDEFQKQSEMKTAVSERLLK
jgi:hypothetical protein